MVATRKSTKVDSNRSTATPPPRVFIQEPSAPATVEDRLQWKGFCEIESEPAFFNVMLQRFGVQGVKVHEVVSLEDEILAFLPRPVYGLIFLFKWLEEDADKQEHSCPEGIWFANQTSNNACASVALLNIVNNIPDIELGENLRNFRNFTSTFSPALRGDAIINFEYVRNIHNSFARKTDMLNADLHLKNEATAKGKGKGKGSSKNKDEDESGFHFIAFMPIGGELWKFDGLERQPMCLGDVEENWLGQAKPDIEARMAQYEEGQIEFAILGLVRDPLPALVAELAKNIKSITSLTAQLNDRCPDWLQFQTPLVNGEPSGLLTAADPAYTITQNDIDAAQIPQETLALSKSEEFEKLVTQRQRLVTAQAGLRLSIRDEQQSNQSDQDRANTRCYDFGARMQNFVRKVKMKRRTLDDNLDQAEAGAT